MAVISLRRFKDLEIRFLPESKNGTLEIIHWYPDDKHCYVLAFIEACKEDIDIRFVADRPFADGINQAIFWALLKFGSATVKAAMELDRELARLESL